MLLLVIIVGCERSDLPVAPDMRPPLAQILDGAHNGGNSHFYFLSPIVRPSPTPAGTLDAGLLPHLAVRICALNSDGDCAAVLATLTSQGQGPARLRIENDERPHFHANWHTGQSSLNAATHYRITVRAAGTELGHADVDVVNAARELAHVAPGYAGLVKGQTLPVKFLVLQGGVFVIGQAGGTITAFGGDVRLLIPPGAVPENTGITIELVTDAPSTEGFFVVGGAVYDFGPDDFEFDQPVQLTIAYDEANLPAGVQEKALQLLHFASGSWQAVPGSTVNTTANTVSGPISSFSPYGVGGSTPAKLAFLVQPTDATAGQTISPAIEVEVQDATGARVITATNAVTLAVASGPTFGTLLGTTTVNAVNGVATFANVRIEKAGGQFIPYTLDASATGLTGATSNQFKIFPGAAAKVFFAFDVAHGVAGRPLAGRPGIVINVQVVDAFENEVNTSHAITVSIGSNPAGGVLSGTATQTGTSVVFTDLAIDNAGSGYTLIASSGTLPSATSAPFDITNTFAKTGTAIIDGGDVANEWNSGSCTLVELLTPAGITGHAKICFMNDASNVYFFGQTLIGSLMPTRALTVEFDANGSGAIDSGDDLIYVVSPLSPAFFDGLLFQAACVGPTCCLNVLCQAPDTDAGFQTNGAGAHSDNVGNVLLEMSHPLKSGEAVDISVAPGQQIGARITFTLADANDNRVHAVIPATGLVQLLIQ